MISIKRMFVGNPIGSTLLTVRDKLQLLHAVYFEPSALGMLSNDFLASYLISSICSGEKTFIDVGAHIGSIISSVQSHIPSAKIIAIEADPAKKEHLKRRFPDVELHQVALGNSEGVVKFFVNPTNSGYSSLIQPDSHFVEISVPMTKLDTIIRSDNIDTIKIDVEGAELGVLKGSINTINRNRPIIMYESGPLSTEQTDTWQFFKSIDYTCLIPNRLAHDGEGLSLDTYLDSHVYPRRTTNYFAVPLEKRQDYRDRARTITL